MGRFSGFFTHFLYAHIRVTGVLHDTSEVVCTCARMCERVTGAMSSECA